jgi:hypothetical protein
VTTATLSERQLNVLPVILQYLIRWARISTENVVGQDEKLAGELWKWLPSSGFTAHNSLIEEESVSSRHLFRASIPQKIGQPHKHSPCCGRSLDFMGESALFFYWRQVERKASCWLLSFLSSDYVMMVRATVFFALVGLAGEWTERSFFGRINMYMNCRNREPAHNLSAAAPR